MLKGLTLMPLLRVRVVSARLLMAVASLLLLAVVALRVLRVCGG